MKIVSASVMIPQQRVIGFWSHDPDTALKQAGARKFVSHLFLISNFRYYVFSNWAPAEFELDGKKYRSVEQRMMEQKVKY